MYLALCPHVVSQASQHFRSSRTQSTLDHCFDRQSAWSFPFTLAFLESEWICVFEYVTHDFFRFFLDMWLGAVNLLMLWSELCLFVSELNEENEADRTVRVVVVDGI